MRIDSDFEDYYDTALGVRDSESTLVRRREHIIPRRVAYGQLEMMGWPTVAHGITTQMYKQTGNRFRFVVYRDEFTHGVNARGYDPLVLVRPSVAVEQWPDALCSFYTPCMDGDYVVSYSFLSIGRRAFLLTYHQRDKLGDTATSWASNRGRFDVQIVRELGEGFNHHMPVPVWSVDYVMAARDKTGIVIPMAFDLNEAPRLIGTGIEKILSADDVADLVVEAADYYQDQQAREEQDRLLGITPQQTGKENAEAREHYEDSEGG